MKKIIFFLITIISLNIINAQNSRSRRTGKEVGQYDNNEKKTGEWKFYAYNGKLDLIIEYVNGERHGVYKNYRNDGELYEIGEYVNGKKHGEWKTYHKNGNLSTVGLYKNDFQQGEWKDYYGNGKLKETGEYSEGFKNGLWKEYNEVQKRYIITKYRAGSRAFHDLVFRETTLDFDTKTNELLIPTPEEPRRRCGFREKPDRYTCSGGGGRPSHNFLDKGEKNGNFKVAIFHPSDKTRESLVSLTSFVEDGKVTAQSRCFYDVQGLGLGTENKRHYEISRMKCYVITPELSEVINGVTTLEDIKDESRYQRFLSVLKSSKYKESLLEAYKYNWEKAFLNVNREEHYDYYSKLNEKRYYNLETHGKDEESKLLNFEELKFIKESKSLYEILSKAKTLFKNVYLNPCLNLENGKIFAVPKTE